MSVVSSAFSHFTTTLHDFCTLKTAAQYEKVKNLSETNVKDHSWKFIHPSLPILKFDLTHGQPGELRVQQNVQLLCIQRYSKSLGLKENL